MVTSAPGTTAPFESFTTMVKPLCAKPVIAKRKTAANSTKKEEMRISVNLIERTNDNGKTASKRYENENQFQ